MDLVVFILVVVGCILCHTLSTSYNQKVEGKYYQGCINWWWSVTTAVLLAGTFLTIGEETFQIFLLLTIGCACLSAWLCYQKMLSWGATAGEAGWGSVAQIASAIGIAAAILFILLIFFGGPSKKRRRR